MDHRQTEGRNFHMEPFLLIYI